MEESVQTNIEITSDDKLWAALSWLPLGPLYPLVAVLMLLMEEKRNNPFVRYNAVLALVTGVVLFVLAIPTMGLAAIGYLVFFYWAYQAAQGQTVQIPVLSDWIKEQGWVEK